MLKFQQERKTEKKLRDVKRERRKKASPQSPDEVSLCLRINNSTISICSEDCLCKDMFLSYRDISSKNVKVVNTMVLTSLKFNLSCHITVKL